MNTKTARKVRKPLSAEEMEARKAKRAAQIAAMESAAESFDLDDAGKATMRAYDDLCTHYSEGNAFLILAQAAEQELRVRGLKDIGAFGTWMAQGRSPRKGVHATIFVWAPAGSPAQADKVTEEAPTTEIPDGAKSTRKLWRLAPLFHRSQTEAIKAKEEASA